MKRFLLLTIIVLLGVTQAYAQVKNLYGEARMSYQEGLSADYVNVVLDGNITPSLSYFWRQRFNKPLFDPAIPLNATDMLYLQWDISDKWSLQGGKIPVVVGGYEFDDAPIDLYYWDAFAGGLADVYAIGGNFIWKPAPQQSVMLQLSQSLLGFGFKDVYHAALLWYGQIAPWWKTIYSVNWMDDPTHTGLGILGLGNRFEMGPLAMELDFQYRTALRGAGIFSADYGVIGKLELALPFIKVFAKGGYDYNWNCPIDVMPEQYRFFYAGGGLEVFPLDNEDLRLHAVTWWNTDVRRIIYSIGVTYRFRVVK